MRLDAEVLVDDDEPGPRGQGLRGRLAAAVALHVSEQDRPARRDLRLQLAQGFQSKRSGAICGPHADSRQPGWKRVLEHGEAEQRHA